MVTAEMSVKRGEAREYDRVEPEGTRAYTLCSSVVYGLEKREGVCHFWLSAWKGGCHTYWVETE